MKSSYLLPVLLNITASQFKYKETFKNWLFNDVQKSNKEVEGRRQETKLLSLGQIAKDLEETFSPNDSDVMQTL